MRRSVPRAVPFHSSSSTSSFSPACISRGFSQRSSFALCGRVSRTTVAVRGGSGDKTKVWGREFGGSVVAFSDEQKETAQPLKVDEETGLVRDSDPSKETVESLIEETETIVGPMVKHDFKSETSKLLDIVAHSLYTDKEVFVRELISNASDALEKLRHLQTRGEKISDPYLDLEIHLSTDPNKRSLIIQDFGVGMTKEELIENLGTIAHSGTTEFLKQLESGQDKQSIIGQFGVGFYSAFMVGKSVKVYSRSSKDGSVGYCWSSDGTGAYQIAEAEGVSRGTKIVIDLKENAKEFSNKKNIETIVKKYSNFVGFPIKLNGERVNTIKALWLASPGSVTDAEHRDFYQFLAKTYDEPLYRLHFSSDSPLSIRALFYVPEQHTEKFGLGKMESGVSLFSRKVLVQGKMASLLPDWLRFMKGVVDCEDVTLHLSREHLQDSELIRRLGNLLTSRILKDFADQAKRDGERYNNKFWREFANFLKEGICTDAKWKDEIAPLLRCETSNTEEGELISLDDYISKIPDDQKSIYYLSAPSRSLALISPYYEGFKEKNVEVLFLYSNIDDFVMQNLAEYRGRRLSSIETAEVPGADERKKTNEEANTLPPEEVDDFTKWMKSTLIDKVTAIRETTRLVNSPAIVVDHESASFRRMMKFADPNRAQKLPKQRLEVNTTHPIIIKLNALRKVNPAFAVTIAEQVYDDALIAAGLLEDPRAMLNRLNTILEKAVSVDTK